MEKIDTSTEAVTKLLDGVTPGPWNWQVSRSMMTVELSGGMQSKAGGDLTVMSFARYGMYGAAPVFWTWDGLTATRVERADKIAISVPGREHHAGWFARIDHPDARFIAAARDLVPALLAERDALKSEIERLKAQPVTVQDAAKVPDVKALIIAAMVVHDSYWNSTDGVIRGMYDIGEALRAIAEGRE